MKAKSINGKSAGEIKDALTEFITDGFNPTLAFVFLSGTQNIGEISKILDERKIQIFGTTATGEFTEHGVETDSIAVLLLDINHSNFKLMFKDIFPESAKQTASQFASESLAEFVNPAFIIAASNVTSPGEDILSGFTEKAGDNITVIGGIASDQDWINGSRVFTNNRISSQALICLAINQDRISVNGSAVSGWKPVGTVKTVTKSEGNKIFTIDDQPALDLIIKYTGIKVDPDNNEDIYTQLGSSMPLQVQKSEGLPVMKPPIMFNPSDHSIFCGGVVPEGTKIRFSLPPDFDVIEEVIKSAQESKLKAMPEAEAMLIFSCHGRLEAFGPLVDKEIEGLQEVWNVPMAGFFSFGEWGKPLGGKSDFHGTTCSWVLLKENKDL